jgi:uncharacterized coiled-coil DUF342 family protein
MALNNDNLKTHEKIPKTHKEIPETYKEIFEMHKKINDQKIEAKKDMNMKNIPLF